MTNLNLVLFNYSLHVLCVRLHSFNLENCTLDKSGQVSVAFLGSYFKSSQVKYDFLFFTYSDSDINLNKSTDAFTLNEQVYAQVRQAIVEKLGNRAKTFVKNIDI